MKTAVVILPGRGTYNKSELGVLQRHFPQPDLLAAFDRARQANGQDTLSSLDSAARYSNAVHGRGDNASSLIFAASLGDFLSLDQDRVQVVAVTGNSMGWYTTLACAGALEPMQGFQVANTMGAAMQAGGQGGQLVYPHMGPDWVPDPERKRALLDLVAHIHAVPEQALKLSIDLGGHLVLAGNAAGLDAFSQAVPAIERFPMRLAGHVGFHSDLVKPVSDQALAQFEAAMFRQPRLPMIDGRGHIWWPGASDPAALKAYTFRHQVVQPYNFTRAIEVAAREFAPDLFVVTGPGTTLGGAVAQSLIQTCWRSLSCKADFTAQQSEDPIVISMGLEAQRGHVV